MTKTVTETVSRPKKTEDGFTIIYDLDSIPAFDDEGDEAAFWDTHTYSEEILDKAVRPPIESTLR